jgi:hypothetical protein
VARVRPVPPIIVMYIQEMGRIEAEPQGAALTPQMLSLVRAVDRLHSMVGHVRARGGP